MLRRLLPLSALAIAVNGGAEEVPITGTTVAGMESADRAYLGFIKRHQIPGGSVAIMKDGRLVYARGFGWADLEKKKPVKPETLFRIASISKPVTALAVATLVEDGTLSYELKALPYLGYPTPNYQGAKRDPRLDTITVRHLLEHSGGWDRESALDPAGNKGFDPMFHPRAAARDLTGREQPVAGPEMIARWMVGKPLQYDPGSHYSYSNLGYCLLGRVIEKATGQPYEQYVRSLLRKADIQTMWIGGSKRGELREKESLYYPFPGAEPGKSVWNEAGIPSPYRFSMPALDSHGGWIASASDLVRFTTLLDGRPRPADLINAQTIRRMRMRPDFAPPASEKNNYYGFGWSFWERKDGQFRNWFHSGSLPGTMSMLIRSDNGITWAAVFNMRPKDSGAAFKDLDSTMWKAVRGVTQWP
jgi:N-acyl-D-amino-acid deacylase